MRKRWLILLFLGCIAWNVETAVAAEDAAREASSPEPATRPQFPRSAEEKIEYGFDFRVRSENWNNIQDANGALDDERHQVRFRTRTWAKLSTESLGFYVRLANEFKKQTTPEATLSLDEVFFDSLYLDIKKLPVRGLAIRIGRQDLAPKGEGLIIADPTSGDGSRSMYTNAVNLSYTISKSKVEILGILDPRQDRFVPVLHDQRKNLTEWEEQAAGAYITERQSPHWDLDGYYFYKKEVNDYRAPTNRLFQPDRHVQTTGTRIVHSFAKNFTAAAEYARQWGAQRDGTEIAAWAFTTSLKKQIRSAWNPYVLIGYTALSGDNPGTSNRIEGWDPLFSRYPKWTELYLYSLVPERGVGYWSNFNDWQFEAGLSSSKRIALRAVISKLGAWHPLAKPANVYGDGTSRGVVFYVRSEFLVRPGVKAHLQWERLVPGDFYSHNVPGYFFRGEISYEFSSLLRLSRRK